MKCKNCGQETNQEDICIHCGENPKGKVKVEKEGGKKSTEKENLSSEKPKEKKKISKAWGCVGCIGLVILIIIIGSIGCSSSDNKNKTTEKSTSPSATSSTPATPTPTPKAKEWVVVIELKGTTDKRSDTFELTGGKTKMTYNFNGNDWIVGSIYIVQEGHDLNKEGGFPEVSISKSGEDSTFLSKGKGKYFLDVKAGNTTSWTIKIEEEK